MKIKRFFDYREAIPFLKKLSEIHYKVFSKPPWNFSIDQEESIAFLRANLFFQGQIFLVGLEDEKPIGAALASPLVFHLDLASLLDSKEVEDAIYLTRIFVDEEYQGRNFGKELHDTRLEYARQDNFKFALHRTSAQSRMYQIVTQGGFKPIFSMPVMERHKTILGDNIYCHKPRIVSLKEL